MRELFDGRRYVVENGIPWRAMPDGRPPWAAVWPPAMHWLRAGSFAALAHALLRVAAGRERTPAAAILDSRTLQSPPESGARAGRDGAKRSNGAQLPLAVDTLGHRLALHVTPADAQDRAEVGRLAAAVQAATGASLGLAFVDQGDTGEPPAAAAQGIRLEVIELPKAMRGFVLLPRRWVGARSLARAARCRRLLGDYQRRHTTLAGLPGVACPCLRRRQDAEPLQVHNSR